MSVHSCVSLSVSHLLPVNILICFSSFVCLSVRFCNFCSYLSVFVDDAFHFCLCLSVYLSLSLFLFVLSVKMLVCRNVCPYVSPHSRLCLLAASQCLSVYKYVSLWVFLSLSLSWIWVFFSFSFLSISISTSLCPYSSNLSIQMHAGLSVSPSVYLFVLVLLLTVCSSISLFLIVCLSVYISYYLSVSLSVSVTLSPICAFVAHPYLSLPSVCHVCLFKYGTWMNVWLYVHLKDYLPVCLCLSVSQVSTFMSFSLFITCLSVCLSVFVVFLLLLHFMSSLFVGSECLYTRLSICLYISIRNFSCLCVISISVPYFYTSLCLTHSMSIPFSSSSWPNRRNTKKFTIIRRTNCIQKIGI